MTKLWGHRIEQWSPWDPEKQLFGMQTVHLSHHRCSRVCHTLLCLGGSEPRFLHPWLPISQRGWTSFCGLDLNAKWFDKQKGTVGPMKARLEHENQQLIRLYRDVGSGEQEALSAIGDHEVKAVPLTVSQLSQWLTLSPHLWHLGSDENNCESDCLASLECLGLSGGSHVTCAWTAGEGSTESRQG